MILYIIIDVSTYLRKKIYHFLLGYFVFFFSFSISEMRLRV